MDWTLIFFIPFGLLGIWLLWIAIKSYMDYSEEPEVIFKYRIRETSRERYRIQIFDESGKSVLITSGNGKKTPEELFDLIDKLERAYFLNEDE